MDVRGVLATERGASMSGMWSTEAVRRACSMDKRQRCTYLLAHGWTLVVPPYTENWHSPAYPVDRAWYTLAAAIRYALDAQPLGLGTLQQSQMDDGCGE